MWSRIASLVDDLNFEDDEEYSDSNSVSEQKGPSLLNSELESTKEELAKYKEKVIQLKEELRDAESNAQDINRDFSKLVNSKEEEIASLKSEVERLTKDNELLKKENSGTQDVVDTRVKEISLQLQKEIDSLKSQLDCKEQECESQIKETTELKEKLIRVESNLQQIHSESPSTSSSTLEPDIQDWLNNYHKSIHSILSSSEESEPLSPPPSLSSSELYLCLENMYTEFRSLSKVLQDSRTQLASESSRYHHLRELLVSTLHLPSSISDEMWEDELKVIAQKAEKFESLQNEVSSLHAQYDNLSVEYQKEKESLSASLSNTEHRCESLKSDIRDYLRKEQEYEDRFDYLLKENQKLQEEVSSNDRNKLDTIISELKGTIRERDSQIESLNIQLATFKTENDSLLIEKNQFRKEMEMIELTKKENEQKQIQIETLQSTINELTNHVEALENEVTKSNTQLKNAQEDLGFAQMCVKNLQASLAVYTTSSQKEEEGKEEEEKVVEEVPTEILPVTTPCKECEEKDETIAVLRNRVTVMDNELVKLRRIVIEEQDDAKKQHDDHALDKRVQRQLLITYLTSVRGGTALKALMENLNLSEEEQRVCLLKEVEKFNTVEKQQSGGLFAWIGGIAMDELKEPVVAIDTNTSVDELWNRLFKYEQSK